MGLQWSKDIAIGNLMIDTQHQMLLLLLRKLELAHSQGLSHKVIVGISIELKKFIDFHFLSEENVMQELHCPFLERHRVIHSEILFQVEMLVQRINRHELSPGELIQTLSAWMIQHVVNEDLKIADYLKVSGAQALGESEYGLYSLKGLW